MRRIAFAVVFLACGLTPALAQKPTPADTAAINACLEKSAVDDTFGGDCIGIIADPCIKAASEKNTFLEDYKACSNRELAVWSALMQASTKEVARHGRDFIAAVTASQKSFTESTAKLCPIYDKLDPGMARGGAAYCRLQETARRALMLRRLALAAAPH